MMFCLFDLVDWDRDRAAEWVWNECAYGTWRVGVEVLAD